jgi:hypothetical protein
MIILEKRCHKCGDTKDASFFNKDKSSKDALSREFPPDYQLLCCNCNRSKHWGNGICIHQREEKESNAE